MRNVFALCLKLKGFKVPRNIHSTKPGRQERGEKATRQQSYLYHLILYVRPYQDTFVEHGKSSYDLVNELRCNSGQHCCHGCQGCQAASSSRPVWLLSGLSCKVQNIHTITISLVINSMAVSCLRGTVQNTTHLCKY